MTTIKNVVFDFGGVLLDWNPRYFYSSIFNDDEKMEYFIQNIVTSTWNSQMDRGRTFEECMKELSEEHPEYKDLITEIARSQSKSFALFAIDEKYKKKGSITPTDFPKTGTLVRLLHAKSVPGEVHFVCEGLCRVQIKEWTKFDKELRAVVVYPQNIEPEAGSEAEVKVKALANCMVCSAFP